ncbi:MAG: MFS transporter, partial [Actinomycetes bacterium]
MRTIGHALGRTPFLKGLPVEVGVVTAVAFFVALGFGILAPAIPVFARTFGVSALAASSVISVFALVRFISSPAAGAMVNRFSERSVLATGLIIVSVSSLAAGFSQNFVQLLILRGVGGLGSTMFTVSALSLLLRTVDAEQRGRATSAYQSGFLFGGIAGPLVGGLVVAFSIRAPFFVYSVSLGIAAIVTLVFLSPSRLRAKENVVAHGEAEALETLGDALRHPAYRAAISVNFITGFVSLGLRMAIVPLFVTEGLRRGATWSGIGFLIAAAVQAVLLLPAGRMADTQGRRKALIIGSIALSAGMLVISISDFAANSLGTASTVGLALFLVALGIQGAGSAFLSSAPAAVVGDIVGGKRGGIVVSTFQMMSDLGIVIGPLVAGLLVDLLDFDWAFIAATAMCLVSLLLVVAMPETLKKATTA